MSSCACCEVKIDANLKSDLFICGFQREVKEEQKLYSSGFVEEFKPVSHENSLNRSSDSKRTFKGSV